MKKKQGTDKMIRKCPENNTFFKQNGSMTLLRIAKAKRVDKKFKNEK